MEHCYYVYILASKSRVLYIGVTNDLRARILQHRSGEIGGFTSDYKVHRLVYYEQHAWIQNAIAREKQLKRWRREKKVWLIERENRALAVLFLICHPSAARDLRLARSA